MTTSKNLYQKNLQKTIVLYIFFICLKIYSSELEVRIDFIEQFFCWFIASKYIHIWSLGVHLSLCQWVRHMWSEQV